MESSKPRGNLLCGFPSNHSTLEIVMLNVHPVYSLISHIALMNCYQVYSWRCEILRIRIRLRFALSQNQKYLPDFVMTISVPRVLNLSQRSLCSRRTVTAQSITSRSVTSAPWNGGQPDGDSVSLAAEGNSATAAARAAWLRPRVNTGACILSGWCAGTQTEDSSTVDVVGEPRSKDVTLWSVTWRCLEPAADAAADADDDEDQDEDEDDGEKEEDWLYISALNDNCYTLIYTHTQSMYVVVWPWSMSIKCFRHTIITLRYKQCSICQRNSGGSGRRGCEVWPGEGAMLLRQKIFDFFFSFQNSAFWCIFVY